MHDKAITLRLPQELLKRIDQLIPKIGSHGDYQAKTVNRSTVIRLALVRGLDHLEREFEDNSPALSLPPVTTIEADLDFGHFSQAEIARRHQCSRQNVSKMKKRLEREGKL